MVVGQEWFAHCFGYQGFAHSIRFAGFPAWRVARVGCQQGFWVALRQGLCVRRGHYNPIGEREL